MKKTQSRWFRALPWFILACGYLGTVFLLAWKGRAYLDSDNASDMVLSNILNQEGTLMSANWWHSTELHVFNLQIFYRLGLLLFPQDWYTAHVFGQALWILALLAAYFYLAKGMGLKQSGVWGAAALSCPFGAWYFWYGAFCGCYLPNMVLVLVALGAMLRVLKSVKKCSMRGIFLLAWSFLAGVSSLKTIMALFLPMAVVGIAMWLNDIHRNRDDKGRKLAIISVLSLIAAGCGYLVNVGVLLKKYSCANLSSMVYSAFYLDDFLAMITRFFTLFGYPADDKWSMNIRILSIPGVLGAFGILTGVAVAVSLIRLLLRLEKLSMPQRVAPALLLSMILVQGLIFTMAGEGINSSYWLLTVPFAFPVLQLAVETEEFRLPNAKKLVTLGLCVCMVCTSATSVFTLFRHGLRSDPNLMTAAEQLDEMGYTQGYATPWHANAVTEWTSGRVEVWVTNDFSTGEPFEWLQSKSHAEAPEGRIFVLTTEKELAAYDKTALMDSEHNVYSDESYIILDFDSASDMMAAFAD